jgi:hypothetical protein
MKNLFILISLSLLTCCKKGTTNPANNNSGTYSFEYTFKGQKYSWSGAKSFVSNVGPIATFTTDLKITLVRDAPNTTNYYPTVSISVPNTGTGQFELDENTGKITPQNPYPSVCGIILGVATVSSNVYTSGNGNGKVTVKITEINQGSGGHVKGSFSGTLCNLDGVAEPITGSFDAYRLF